MADPCGTGPGAEAPRPVRSGVPDAFPPNQPFVWVTKGAVEEITVSASGATAFPGAPRSAAIRLSWREPDGTVGYEPTHHPALSMQLLACQGASSSIWRRV